MKKTKAKKNEDEKMVSDVQSDDEHGLKRKNFLIKVKWPFKSSPVRQRLRKNFLLPWKEVAGSSACLESPAARVKHRC